MSKDKPSNIPVLEYDRITDQLLAGRNPLDAEEMEELLREGVTHILDLRHPEEWEPPKIGQEAVDFQSARGMKRECLEIPDFGIPTAAHFETAVLFLKEALQDPTAQVYVHCRAGMERTPTILIAFFALQWKTDYAETLRRLKEKRPVFHPLPEQREAVIAWLRSRETNPPSRSF